jgi:hypothetical protein
MNSAGVPWTVRYIECIGDPTCDLRSNIAAEARAKIVYERLINVTDDPGVKEAKSGAWPVQDPRGQSPERHSPGRQSSRTNEYPRASARVVQNG